MQKTTLSAPKLTVGENDGVEYDSVALFFAVKPDTAWKLVREL